jgi:hypothetical protein
MAFDQTTRNRLNRFVADARKLLASEFTRQLQSTYGMNPVTGDVAVIKTLVGLKPTQQESAQLLRDTFEHYLVNGEKGKEKDRRVSALDRIVREQAFTVLNRIAALRMSEARGFLIESIANGYESKGFQLFHRIAGTSLGETGDAYRHYLFSIFDEFSLDLSVLFDRFSAQGRLFPSTPVLIKLLNLVNDDEVAQLWAEDETIGWIYQYFNSQEERKKMRDASQAPRNSRELAVRNQFFTPRYVVEFLTDNTLGRIWYEMTQGKTKLVDECEYLLRRPNEIFLMQDEQSPEVETPENLSQEELLKQTVYNEYRVLKDPREIRMLDPACGSMHFGLYCFDLFERIYEEAWDIEIVQGVNVFIREDNKQSLTETFQEKSEFLKHVPRLIIENNIHGVDIDPRAVQVAGLSLWQRAHNSWQQAGIKPQQRPQISKSNIVCAEPMPGEKELLQEFTSQLKPTVLGQLVEVIFEKMQLAGEAGTLLKIEKEIEDAIDGAKAIWQQQNQALNQFPDLAKIAKQRGEIDFDVSGIDDEDFWRQVEQKILDALAIYASSASAQLSGQKRLFAADAANGFAFIDLCKKRFDVVLMNPPFGESSQNTVNYIDFSYPNYNKNILTAFIIRAIQQNPEGVSIGAIYDKTILVKSSYEKFRRSYITADSSLYSHIDLGWDVLDANVEVACSIINTRNKNEGVFLDVRDEKPSDKAEKISNLINELNNQQYSFGGKLINGNNFSKFPNSVIGHDFPGFVINSFSVMNKFNEFTTCFEGHTLKSDRYFRSWWEVPTNTVFDQNSPYKRLYNGGGYQKYISPLTDVALLGEKNRIALADKSSVFRNVALQGQGVIGFGKRGTYIDAHVVPLSFISTVEGKHVIINKNINPYSVLAFINSDIFQFIINLYCGQHKYPGYVGIIPVPDLINSKSMELAGELCQSIYKLLSTLQFAEETSAKYGNIGTVNIWQKNTMSKIEAILSEVQKIEMKMNRLIIEDYCINEFDLRLINNFNKNLPKQIAWWNTFQDKLLSMKLSYLLGAIFKRWSIVINTTEELPFKAITNASHCLNVVNPAFDAILLKSDDSNFDFYTNLKVEYELLIKRGISDIHFDDFVKDVTDTYRLQGIVDYFIESKCFIIDHINQYSGVPIYWFIQSSSKSLTIILYFQNINAQTLLNCINDYIQPQLDESAQELKILFSKVSRSLDEEKKVNDLSSFVLEIDNLKDEMLKLSKFWQPNLNDGIQITAAPLWQLFQHKAWQKKLKETWGKLEDGDYDWAHLAFSIWPERVLKKCHVDRSLAVSHNVENELWHEVEVIKGRKKEPVWEWQPKPLTDSDLRIYIKEKIETDDRLALYRSNNANGGA